MAGPESDSLDSRPGTLVEASLELKTMGTKLESGTGTD